MNNVRLQSARETNPLCWATGFIAMDIIETRDGDIAMTGGSCGNVIALLAWLGWDTQPIARLGQDSSGTFVREELEALGVNLRYVSTETNVQTPIVLQRFRRDEAGNRIHRFSLTCPECGGWLPRYRAATLKQAAPVVESKANPKVFYFDRVSPAALQLAAEAQARGALVVFEPASIGDEGKFESAVDLADIFKYAHDRLGHLPDLAIANAPKIIVETQGPSGLRVRWRGRWTQLDAVAVDTVLDAAGAGDWCTATLIHRLGQSGAQGLKQLRKSELLQVLQQGQALAAVNCQFVGARGAMEALTLDQINQELRRIFRAQPPVGDAQSGEDFAGPPSRTVAYCQHCPDVAAAVGYARRAAQA